MKHYAYIFFIPFFVFLFSCKMSKKNNNVEPQNKAHALERTKWKHSASAIGDIDIMLDFYTAKYVQEYLTLPNGTTTKGSHGTYKLKSQHIVNIKWNEGKHSFENVTAEINNKTLTITGITNKTVYQKIEDY